MVAAETATGTSPAPKVTPPTPNVIGAPDFCPSLMTGQLVARYKKTHDEDYQAEYERRLRSLGFTNQEAEQLFVFELMILKHDAIERLASPDYLASNCFDLQHPLLMQDESWYVDHQHFLCSEITKIWDEAEWHYWNSHERKSLPDEVWGEIHRLSRYGGGKLLVDYLTMLSEKSGVDMAKIQAYSAAEQQLIFAYKWNRGQREQHPYPAGQGTAVAGGATQKPATASASGATPTASQPKKDVPAAATPKPVHTAKPKPAQTAEAQKVKRRAVNAYFADPEDVSVDGYCVFSSGDVGYETKDVTVWADPFRHRYSEITERETWNSHGTDSHESRYVRPLTADEAVAALAPEHADVAERLERFERSCVQANAACEDLLRKKYPGWTVDEVRYNSCACTLLRVHDDEGRQRALKLSRGDEEDVRRLRDFRQALERAGGCPHIVRLEDICCLPVGNGPRVMLERMPLLRPAYDVSGGPVSWRTYANVASTDGQGGSAYRVALDIARALAKMHELGYVHMDVRPENILVDEEGRFVLADLASVRKVSEQYEGNLQTSTEFRAPEIARHEPFGTDADVFAWGRSVLFALMDKPRRIERPETCVYTVARGRIHHLALYRDGDYVGGCDCYGVEGLLEVALKACAQDRGERYRDGTELVAALESLA